MNDIINSVDRALDVIIYLYDKKQEMSVSDIARDLGTHKSTIFRTLKTLENKGFIEQNPDNEKYWLGPKFYTIGLVMKERFSFTEFIKPHANELMNEFHEVINVSILEKNMTGQLKSVIIYKLLNENKILSVNPGVGSATDFHCSSVGKCLLAFSEQELIQEAKHFPLKKYTSNTVTNWDDMEAQLSLIRQNGYAMDEDEQEVGLTCIGAPIFDKSGKIIAAISMSGPTNRIKNETFQEKIQKVKETAGNITYELR